MHKLIDRLSFAVLLLICIGCADSSKPTIVTDHGAIARQPDPGPLDGTWGVVTIRDNGEPRIVPRARLRYTFAGDRLSVGESTGTEWIPIRFDTDKTPKRFDAGTPARMERYIYHKDGDRLTLCSAPASKPIPTEFETEKGDERTLVGLRRLYIELLDTPVTDREFKAVIEAWESAVRAAEPDGIDELFDVRGILERITDGYGIPETTRLSFIHGILRTAASSLGTNVIKSSESARYDLLRTTRDAQDRHAQFRLVSADGGVAYHELLVGRDCFGAAKVIDFYSSLVGEWFSDLQLRALSPWIQSMSPSFLDAATAAQKASVASRDEVRQLVLHLGRGEIDQAIKVYQSLPDLVQQEKWLLTALSYEAVQKDHNVDFLVQRCGERYPGDPAFNLLFLKHHIAKGEYRKAHQAIDALDKSVGGDHYLRTLHAEVFLAAGKLAEAKREAEAVTKADRTFRAPYLVLIKVSLKTKDYENAGRLLTILEADLGQQAKGLDSLEDYGEFAKTTAYRRWRQSVGGK